MTRFINPEFPAHHHGAGRMASVSAAARQVRQAISGIGGLGLLRLSVLAAALLAVAYGVMDSAEEGHLLVMWMVLWAALLAVLALLAPAVKGSFDAWSGRRAQGRADQRLWAMAQQDPCIMADLQLALLRENALAGGAKRHLGHWPSLARLGQW